MNLPSVLIAGHGYVGTALAQALHEEEAPVTALNRRGSGSETDYPVVSADISNAEAVATVAKELNPAPAFIVHCAASGRGGGVDAYRAVYVEGMKNLKAAFPGVPILFTSSTGVYGQDDGSTVTEESETKPNRDTGQLLLEAETIALETGGIALRLAGIYGPGRSIYLQRILEDTATVEPNWPPRYINQIHRKDIVGAILHLLTGGASAYARRTFNVVDGTIMTQRQCYEGLAEGLELPLPPEAPAKAGPRGLTSKIVSCAALKATGWEPVYPSYFEGLKNDPELIPSILEKIEASGDS